MKAIETKKTQDISDILIELSENFTQELVDVATYMIHNKYSKRKELKNGLYKYIR